MADGFDFQGLLGNPNFNQGIGLLAGVLGRPTSVGEAVQPGITLGQAAGRNQIQRERLLGAQRKRQAQEKLKGLLAGDGPPDQKQLLGLLADVAPDEFARGLLGQAFPKPQQATSFQRDFKFLRGLGFPEQKAIETLKRGTTVNVGDRVLDKPLSPSDIDKIRLPDGSNPAVGTTMRQAKDAGGVVVSPGTRKAIEAADKFQPVLNRIEELALGKKDASGKRTGGVFSNIEPGLGNRVKAGVDLFVTSLTGENPDARELDSLVLGTLAPIIRQLGEAGALSDGDVKRAMGLLPQIRDNFLLPDTGEDASRKLDTLREILERGEKKLRVPKSKPAKAKAPAVIDFNDLPG